MTKVAEFLVEGEELSTTPLHYTMCGLDDVYLLNGFIRHNTTHGPGVSIKSRECLNQAIGLYLIKNRKVLGPKDLRFLRKNMGLTQDELACDLGTTSQTLARYEKRQTEIPGPVDRLIRLTYVLSLIPEGERQKLLEELQTHFKQMKGVDETSDEPVYFREDSSEGWMPQGATNFLPGLLGCGYLSE